MLEIESRHIAELDDEMLRNLIGLLCEEELKSHRLDIRNVMWGGNQNASDGGIDVYCEYEGTIDNNSFVPRNKTGFQVKLSDYTPSKIKDEMLKNGLLKESIQELCKEGGAYILVCGRSSISHSAYKNRINAMREAVCGNQGADDICLDYFDGNRIATWVRSYPSIIVWVREKIDRTLQGWRSFGEWSDIQHKTYKAYVIDQEKRLYDYLENQEITVLEGIQKFRSMINKGAAIIRLTGLSGVGKTRFLEELFDKEIGTNAISATKVIYADAANTLCPTTEQMLKELIIKNTDVVVIIDNCSSSLHKQLMQVCRGEKAKLSLITVEYDVTDENAEETAAFVLKPATDNVIEILISQNYPGIPLAVVRHLVELSGDNARLALLLAKCAVEFGRDINTINDSQLFNRLFWQKGQEDIMLEKTAEVFSLLYSVDYEDEEEESELYKLSEMADIKLRDVVRNLEELKKRDILQIRGKWCAILPHALSNYLAKRSIQYFREIGIRKELIFAGTERMKTSFAHRISFLGNDDIVSRIAEEWLKTEFRDLASVRKCQADCFSYLAKVKPQIALEYIERDWDRLRDYSYQMNKFMRIVSDLVYCPDYFAQCIELLIKRGKGSSLFPEIQKYFQYNAYMYKQCADVRLEKIKQWIESGKEKLAFACLEKALERSYWFGVEYGEYNISNRVIKQNTEEDERYWFFKFIGYIKELVIKEKLSDLLELQQFGDNLLALVRQGFGNQVYEVVASIRQCIFWREGFVIVQRKLHFKDRYTDYAFTMLKSIAKLLEPQNMEEEIIYWCTSSTYEIYDLDNSIEETSRKHSKKLKYYGKMLANNLDLFKQVCKTLILSQAKLFLFVIGRELAKSIYYDEIWTKTCDVLSINKYSSGSIEILNGLLTDQVYENKVEKKLASLLADDALVPAYISVVAKGNFFQKEFSRFYQVVKEQKADIKNFFILNQSRGFLELSLKDFMLCINTLDKYESCDALVFNLISYKLLYEKDSNGEIKEEMKCEILAYLVNSTLSLYNLGKDVQTEIIYSYVKTIISLTCNEVGDYFGRYVSSFYRWVKEDIEQNCKISYEVSSILSEMYKLQPILFLDVFVENAEHNSNVLRELEDGIHKGPLSENRTDILVHWCNQKPDERYDKVFDCIFGYEYIEGKYQWGECVIAALNYVLDRKAIVDKLIKKIAPVSTNSSWSVERERRTGLFDLFETDYDVEIVEMAKNRKKEYLDRTEMYRRQELEREKQLQRFE